MSYRGGVRGDGSYGSRDSFEHSRGLGIGRRRVAPTDVSPRNPSSSPRNYNDAEVPRHDRGGRGRGGYFGQRGRGRSRGSVFDRLQMQPGAAQEHSEDEYSREEMEDLREASSDDEPPPGFSHPGRYIEDLEDSISNNCQPRAPARVVTCQASETEQQRTGRPVGTLPPVRKREGPIAGIICLCNHETMPTMIERRVCGLPKNCLALTERIVPGTSVFIYNFSTKELHGIYTATGETRLNLDPHAFSSSGSPGSDYPAQWRFDLIDNRKDLVLKIDSFKHIVTYVRGGHFELELTSAQVEDLLQIYNEMEMENELEEKKRKHRKAKFAPLEPSGKRSGVAAPVQQSGRDGEKRQEPALADKISEDVESFLASYFQTGYVQEEDDKLGSHEDPRQDLHSQCHITPGNFHQEDFQLRHQRDQELVVQHYQAADLDKPIISPNHGKEDFASIADGRAIKRQRWV